MSTDNLKIDSKVMDRFRKILTDKHGKYHGLLTPEATKAIDEYCNRLEAEGIKKEDVQQDAASSRDAREELTSSEEQSL